MRTGPFQLILFLRRESGHEIGQYVLEQEAYEREESALEKADRKMKERKSEGKRER